MTDRNFGTSIKSGLLGASLRPSARDRTAAGPLPTPGLTVPAITQVSA